MTDKPCKHFYTNVGGGSERCAYCGNIRNVYLETIDRLEPDVAMIDAGAFYASAAISLKRIADALEWRGIEHPLQWRLSCKRLNSNPIHGWQTIARFLFESEAKEYLNKMIKANFHEYKISGPNE